MDSMTTMRCGSGRWILFYDGCGIMRVGLFINEISKLGGANTNFFLGPRWWLSGNGARIGNCRS